MRSGIQPVPLATCAPRGANAFSSHSSGKALFACLAACFAGVVAAESAVEQDVAAAFTLTPDDEALIQSSRELEDLFIRHGLRYEDPELKGWLNAVGMRLAPASGNPQITYRFFLLRDPAPNAFGLQDGQVYVNTGMLARLTSEAQLAAILAHEIYHVEHYHPLIARRAAKGKQITSMVIGGFLSVGIQALGPTLATLEGLAFSSIAQGYSPALELEADHSVPQRLLAARYDAREAPTMLHMLAQGMGEEDAHVTTIWMDRHGLENRARAMQAQVDAMQSSAAIAAPDEGSARYADRVFPIALLTVIDYTRADHPRSALALARGLNASRPDDTAVLVAMGDAWQALGAADEDSSDDMRAQVDVATPQGAENLRNNLDAARGCYVQALARDPALGSAQRGLGEVYEQMGAPEDAARAYLAYVEGEPAAPDHALIMQRLRVLLAEIKAERARQ